MHSQNGAPLWPSTRSLAHALACCTCTPRLSSTLYSLLGLYLSVFLVVIPDTVVIHFISVFTSQ